MGITEETDAIAVVVSEQRGTISLCTGGVLHMGLNGPTLRRELLARVASAERMRWPWMERLMRRWESAISGAGAARAHRGVKGGTRPSRRTDRSLVDRTTEVDLPDRTSPGRPEAEPKDTKMVTTGRS